MKFPTMVSQDMCMFMAKSDMNKTDFVVLYSLIRFADCKNVVCATQSHVASHLGIQPSNVSRSVRHLVALGLVIRREANGVKSLHISPELAWKGSARSHAAALDEYRKSKM